MVAVVERLEVDVARHGDRPAGAASSRERARRSDGDGGPPSTQKCSSAARVRGSGVRSGSVSRSGRRTMPPTSSRQAAIALVPARYLRDEVGGEAFAGRRHARRRDVHGVWRKSAGSTCSFSAPRRSRSRSRSSVPASRSRRAQQGADRRRPPRPAEMNPRAGSTLMAPPVPCGERSAAPAHRRVLGTQVDERTRVARFRRARSLYPPVIMPRSEYGIDGEHHEHVAQREHDQRGHRQEVPVAGPGVSRRAGW